MKTKLAFTGLGSFAFIAAAWFALVESEKAPAREAKNIRSSFDNAVTITGPNTAVYRDGSRLTDVHFGENTALNCTADITRTGLLDDNDNLGCVDPENLTPEKRRTFLSAACAQAISGVEYDPHWTGTILDSSLVDNAKADVQALAEKHCG